MTGKELEEVSQALRQDSLRYDRTLDIGEEAEEGV